MTDYDGGAVSVGQVINYLAEELNVKGVDGHSMINQMKIEAFLNGINTKTVEEIEAFFK